MEKNNIFILITRGIIVRNILRNPHYKNFINNLNYRIIFIIPKRKQAIAEYFYNEFIKEDIKIEVVDEPAYNKIKRLMAKFSKNLTCTKSAKKYFKHNALKRKKRNPVLYYSTFWFLWILSKIRFIKKIYRKIEMLLTNRLQYESLFEKYSPSLILSTSIIAHLDIEFIKFAKLKGIKTISMPRSWDNLDKSLFRVEPDLLLVQNKVMKDSVKRVQAMDSNKVKIIGFPQFDFYKYSSFIKPEDEYYKAKGFDKNLPILFLGSEGPWSKGDNVIFEDIIKSIGEKIPNCNILIRPHFSGLKEINYEDLKENKHIFIDDKFRKAPFFHDNWDPSYEDISDFTSSLNYCNIMIIFSSTLALDAVCFDKPIINISYGIRFEKGKDMSHIMYQTDHFEEVIKTNGTSIANNREELFNLINFYLKNPNYKQSERKALLNKMCYKVDGQSGKRFFNEVENFIKQ